VASSGDIRAGRAAVELYVDQTELQKGLKQAETSIKNVDKNVGAMRAGMLANQFAVGLQDFAVVYEQSGDLSRSLSAAANNAIQLMTLINPMAGALTAAAIAGYQLYTAFSKAGSSAKALKEEVKGLVDGVASFARANGSEEKTAAANRLIQEGNALARESDALSERRNVEMQKRNALLRANENILGFQMDNPEVAAAVARQDAIIAEIDAKKAEADAKLAVNAATQEAVGPEARRAILEDNRRKAQAKKKEDDDKKASEANDEYEAAREEAVRIRQEAVDAAFRAQDAAAREDERLTEEEQREDEKRQREDEKRQSEFQSLTEQFETPAERRARMGQKYRELLLTGPDASNASLETYKRAMASLDQKSTSVVGTFSGAALGGLSASSPLVAIQRATEETAKNTRKTSKGGTFT